MKKIRGFTLLEILLALFIFAIIALIMSLVLYHVFNTRHHLDQNAAHLAKLQLTTTLIERDIEQAVSQLPLTTHLAFPMQGNAEKISFVRNGHSNPLAQLKRSNLQTVSYTLVKGELIRTTDNSLQKSSRVLLTHVSQLRIRYLAKDNQAVNAWPLSEAAVLQGEALPHAVQITMQLQHWGNFQLLLPIPSYQSLQASY